ncbi:hypothetical protein M422DRAFT_245581 [Sphaerobolus stellatus SS14]|nr:hypothetical protein M422DRAFT_245581 [Sphaerobolus stellatus SS14]
MALSFEQLDTLKTVQNTLESAGIFSEEIISSNHAIRDLQESLFSILGGGEPHPLISLIKYSTPPPRDFSPEEISDGANKSTRQGYVSSIVHHPKGAVVEYPETGSLTGKAVTHIFKADISKSLQSRDPKANIQYSLSGPKGSNLNVECFLLRSSQSGVPGVRCTQVKLVCTGYKRCNFNNSLPSTPSPPSQETTDAWQEVFQKTLALFCAVQESGCLFSSESLLLEAEGSLIEENEDVLDIGTVPAAEQLYEILRDRCAQEKDSSQCKGCILFCRDKYYRPFLQCEHRKRGEQAHLFLRNLQEIDGVYLEALFHNNISIILQYEQYAQVAGFGPLTPCTALFSPQEQKMLCSNFHRTQDGKLICGTIEHINNCAARFEFYYPNEPVNCPYVAVVCRDPHSHRNPISSRTPRIVRDLLEELLLKEFCGEAEDKVHTCMMTLASSEELPAPAYDSVVSTILSGGKKAVDWFKDKEAADGWALAAIYRPKSKIPLYIWKAAPSTSNGNEQAHRNINRDGTKLSVVAALQFGQGVDYRQLESIDLLISHGISHREQVQTYFHRSGCALLQSVAVQRRTIEKKDSELEKAYLQLSKLQEDSAKQSLGLKHAWENGENSDKIEHAVKKLKATETRYTEAYSTLPALQGRSSSRVQLPALTEPSRLVDPSVFRVQAPIQQPQSSSSSSSFPPDHDIYP